jgi:hypothetical protein
MSGSSFRRGKTFTDAQVVQHRAKIKNVVPEWSPSKRPRVLGLFNSRSGGEVVVTAPKGTVEPPHMCDRNVDGRPVSALFARHRLWQTIVKRTPGNRLRPIQQSNRQGA